MSIPSIEERVDRVDGEEICELVVEFDSDIVCDEIVSRIILLKWVNDSRRTRVKAHRRTLYLWHWVHFSRAQIDYQE